MRRALTIAALALLGSCTAPVEGGLTGVRVVVTYDVEVDQLLVEAWTDAGALAPITLPEPARVLAPEGEDVVVLLPEMDGDFWARVTGRRGGADVAAGANGIALVRGEIVVLAVHLGDPPTCGDGIVTVGFEECDDMGLVEGDGCSVGCTIEPGWQCTGDAPSTCTPLCGEVACLEGQRCEADVCVCDTTSCPSGCCEGDTCRPGDAGSACGAGGNACEVCSGACVGGVCAGECDATICPDGCCTGATCNPMSVESCGVDGERCEPCVAGSADACVGGECRCGGGSACAAGQRCVAGLCICDETSCPSGCCDGIECRVRGRDTCGVAGATCVACDPQVANSCSSAGTCQCGAGAACADGQLCDASGTCRCTAASCPSGCCAADGTCQAIELASCGAPGGACTVCDPLVADGCDSGGDCACGSGPACAAGQRCDGGSCVCDGLSCGGCCDGETCRPGDVDAQCGSGGADCESCGGSGCSAAGACAGCNSATCASGCCTGSTCSVEAFDACGAGAAACVACDPTLADACVGGTCTCGGGPACEPGQRCDSGSCVCDPSSCPAGCCDVSERCTELSGATCAAPGERCAPCDPTRADSCASDGTCACGSNPACGAGQRCNGGACVCDATSCPTGCCSGETCTTPLTLSACAPAGMTCTACSPLSADRCTASGQCACGTGAPCGAGQRCSGGSCVCDPSSCTGCCDGNVCRPGTTNTQCGTGGGSCVSCSSGPCVSGICTSLCGPGTCGTGCCSGNACIAPPTPMQCGTGGQMCMSCGLQANQCNNEGQCRCGTQAACLPGQECAPDASMAGELARCACTAASCPHGCCRSNQCRTRSLTDCGASGRMCVNCTAGGGADGMSAIGDACDSSGQCRCGAGPACVPPGICAGGFCSVITDPG